ncbi:MAG: tetratricopeptide repeat protein [Acidobacteria bacterium]|nr:tetratricopeptide repeat protein [Acidobacteriota bacterium]MCA1641783.1 tetratricopeptide repeat protein [Acidobacteriota bacterium]
MSQTTDRDRASASRGLRRRELPLAALLVACLGAAVGVARWMDARRPPQTEIAQVSDELYVTPQVARRMSLGFNGLAADWYWLRTLQYVGRKLAAHHGQVQIDDLSSVNLKILAPLLENATTLDPQFLAAYEYGAVVLPAVDTDAAIRLVNKGIEANPKAWRLRTNLGYIYWQQGRYREASEAYGAASRVEGAPAWVAAMSAQMSTKGGSRETARAIYETMLRTTEEARTKEMALNRLAQLRSLDETDALRRILTAYRERAGGRCPSDWREIAPALRAARFAQDASGAPLDPGDVPYHFLADRCDVELGAESKVLRNY